MRTAGGNLASGTCAGHPRPPGGRAVILASGTAVWATLAGAVASPATARPAIAQAAPGTAAMTTNRAGPPAVTRQSTQVHRPDGDPVPPCPPRAADATTRVLRGGSPPTTSLRPITGPRAVRPGKPARRRAIIGRTTSP